MRASTGRPVRQTISGPYPLSLNSLWNRKIGIYGLGRIGKAIGRRLEGFELPINYHNRRPVAGCAYQYYSSLHNLAMAVDTLICAVPGNAATDGSINADILQALGPTGILINIGRSKTVDQDALIFCLENKIISAAGPDVFANESCVSDEMLMLENTSRRPHIAPASVDARGAVANLVIDNLLSWIKTGKTITPIE
ncbi:NAD(P)-dependent oxidoreductase [Falsochrobactrum shanghaiense]|uniref:NAD(P)-dependent oxidoreductase n=1 Tax=Falsochrobactrum shanghaiense TaxID=2201899 RepID=UPI001FE22C87|nr:NAD(P)-dependent oxidoreductase [Falsochrobactrum shanghaiense]